MRDAVIHNPDVPPRRSDTLGWIKLFGALLFQTLCLAFYIGQQYALLGQELSFTRTQVAELKSKVDEYVEIKYQMRATADSVTKLEKRVEYVENQKGAVIR